MAFLSLKVTHGSTKRRFRVPTDSTFAAFLEQLTTAFGLDPAPAAEITLSYDDPDGDTITVSSDPELQEMFSVVSRSTLLVTLHSPHDPPPAAPPQQQASPPTAARDAAAHAAETARAAAEQARAAAADGAGATVEAVLTGLASFLSAFAPPRRGPHRRRRDFPPPPPPPRGPPPFAPFATFAGPPPFAACAAPGGPFASAFAGAPFLGAFASAASGMCDVSERTRVAFRALSDALGEAPNRDNVLAAFRDLFPAFRDWATANVGEGDVQETAVEELCQTVRTAVLPAGGEPITELTSELIRAAAADEAVLRMLRQIPWDLVAGWDVEHGRPSTPRGMTRFNVHRHIECDNCGKTPIIGTRYRSTNRPNYDICADCYNDESVSKEGIDFQECKFIWEAKYPDAAVPPSPLTMGDRSPAVAFLQKLLTDLGYMNASMYRMRVGMFGPNTRAAVEQFQKEYGLEAVTVTGQYDATTAASLTSVIEAQVPPAAAAGGAAAADAQPDPAPTEPQADAPEAY